MTDEQRHCIKCGREIGPDQSICELCNRAGMVAPSASQYHGTVAAAIVLAVAALAIAASLSMRGIGPYAAQVRSVGRPADGAVSITFAVTNQGSRSGRAKCQLVALGAGGERLRTQTTITGQIAGGGTAEETERMPGLDSEPAGVSVSCS